MHSLIVTSKKESTFAESMRCLLFTMTLVLLTAPSAICQREEPVAERGKAEELRGLTRVFVSSPIPDQTSIRRIKETILKKLPHIAFVQAQNEADVWLWISIVRKTETNRIPPNPNEGGLTRETYESFLQAQGRAIVVNQPVRLRVVKKFQRSGGDGKKLAEEFAKEFIRMYQKANAGLDLSTAEMPPTQTVPPALKVKDAASRTSISQPAPTTLNSNQGQADEVDIVRINTNLVIVNASVMDRAGRYIARLSKEDFNVYEEGMKQDISFFATVDEPFTVALLIDTSPSTKSQLPEILRAANAFVDQLRADDSIMAVSFDSEINEIFKLTRAGEVKNRGFDVSRKGNDTRLYDAVSFVIKERFNRITGRKAIILLTDGVDGFSGTTYKSNVREVEESGTLIYPIQFDTYEDSMKELERLRPGQSKVYKVSMKRSYDLGASYLDELARKTGGRVFPASNVVDLARVFANILEELSRQYSLGYYPRVHPQEGERRLIKIHVGLPNVVVRSRDSYIFTSASSNQPDN